ncbi:hypothetical protein ACQEVZ_21995 [Dactylosporangium sp. CA-152071]|uniref:hypothetical protein n=1 Tax=Dactylosporangium sp. CA-152071 TaxID=3239933 RepID=UPI003D8C4D4F
MLDGHPARATVEAWNSHLSKATASVDEIWRLYDETRDFWRTWVGRPTYDGWKGLAETVDWLCEHWDEPDDGIWESRSSATSRRRSPTSASSTPRSGLDEALR